MKSIISSLMLCMAVLMLPSCSCQPDLAGKWNISSVNGKNVLIIGDEQPYLEFNVDENRVHGNTGCNIMNGEFTLNGSNLKFGMMATTMMAGPEENMKTERDILEAVGKVAEVRTVKDKLVLFDSDGNTIMELCK